MIGLSPPVSQIRVSDKFNDCLVNERENRFHRVRIALQKCSNINIVKIPHGINKLIFRFLDAHHLSIKGNNFLEESIILRSTSNHESDSPCSERGDSDPPSLLVTVDAREDWME